MTRRRRDDRGQSMVAARVGLAMQDPLGASAGRGGGGMAYLLDAMRLRPAGRRVLSAVSIVLAVGGAGMFAYPLATDIYTDQVVQERLADRYSAPEYRRTYVKRTVSQGDPLTRLVIPRLKVKTIVVEGTSPAALRAGAGHYPNTPLPGEDGNVGIAGHRTTYGHPFNRLDELHAGDEIRLETPLAIHMYRVVGPPEQAGTACASGGCWITHPRDWSVVAPTAVPSVTLTTCHPKGSLKQRLIVRAELAKSEPRSSPP